jgi:hypothetical protein
MLGRSLRWCTRCSVVAALCTCVLAAESRHLLPDREHPLDPVAQDGSVRVMRDLGAQTTSS